MYVFEQLLIPAAIAGSVYAAMATGFNVMYRTTRIFSFAHGDLIMWAPMGALIASLKWGWGPVPSVLFGMVAALVLGIVIERIAMRSFIGRPRDMQWILSTLGASLILQQIAAEQFGSQPQNFPFGLSLSPLDVGGLFQISPQQLMNVLLAIAMVVLLEIIYRKTILGMRLRAVGEDAEAATSLGISSDRMSLVAAVIAAATAAVAGLAVAHSVLISPLFGTQLLFYGFIAATIGGLGSLVGGLVGAFIIGLIGQAAALTIGAEYSTLLLLGCLVLVFLVRPSGLFGARAVRAV